MQNDLLSKKLIIVALITTLSASEPSAFKAGDLDAKEPYGLTTLEQHVLDNKNKINSMKREIINIKSNFNKIDRAYDGLKSMTNSEIDKLEVIKVQSNRVSEDLSKIELSSKQNKLKNNDRLDSIEKSIKDAIETENKNSKNLSTAIKKMALVIAKLQKTTNDRLNNLENKINALKNTNVTTTKQNSKTKYSFKNKTRFRILQDAKQSFKKKDYKLASTLFTRSIKNKYKPAESNFYLGQIAFLNKDYNNSIYFYKKSSSLSTKTKFMPLLLLNTAKSLEHQSKNKLANKFYKMLLTKYPKSKEAKKVKKDKN